MNSFNAEIIAAYTAVCRSYQLGSSMVLQSFAEALSVINYLALSDETAAHCAAQLFLPLCKIIRRR